MTFIWVVLFLVGIFAAAAASSRAVRAALDVSDSLGVSHGIVGLTVLAIGTDLPEIANSISASVSGHGDLNVGDGTGSALTQITLVLAILLFAAGPGLSLHRRSSSIAITTGAATVVCLVGMAILISDAELSRIDGLVLVVAWLVSVRIIHRREGGSISVTHHGASVTVGVTRTVFWLMLVAVSATAVVRSFVELSDRFGVPEFIASALVLSLGTSLPELVVDWTAIRRSASALAIGDLFGSSLVDSSFAVGIGPLFSATAVSESASSGVLVIAIGCAMATALVSFGRTTTRRMAMSLLAIFAGTSAALIAIIA